ncbi:MAG: homocysteine S-methyltransferase family protein [Clostridia bacterium]|nr:homocysteine S-methyltransferase family protein [Clostridia bacterium]
MKFSDFLKNNTVFFDGGMGTLLYSSGLKSGEAPERWNVTHSDVITAIHRDYYDAGSNVISANTFGASSLHFADGELEEVIAAAFKNARTAREQSTGTQEKFIALDIGSLGKLLKPLGELDFEEAVEIFAKTVRLGVKHGAELIIIETMNDCLETKAALLAAKENSSLPVIVSNAYGANGKLMTGATPAAMVAMLEGMGADAIGANCSFGPKQLEKVVDELLEHASVPVIFQPNAGLPRISEGKTVYDVTPKEFASDVAAAISKGVRIAGGCCGTTPDYIRELTAAAKDIKPSQITFKRDTVVSSYTHTVELGKKPVLIGERINPTGKKRFKQALLEKDIGYILNEGIAQKEKGVSLLDVNVGMPDVDEKEMLTTAVYELQAVTDLPLQIDTSDVTAMEAALRIYNGKPMINSVNGKKESMEAVFPLMKKYGGVAVALTLDENGIPDTAEGRVEIAKRIIKVAKDYGIDKKDLVFDTLAMAVSADSCAASVTLEALKRIKDELGCNTSLGVSNVSFGLPCRDAINSVFFAMALENGLSAAIMNPYSADMMKVYHSYNALAGFDEGFSDYINASEGFAAAVSSPNAAVKKSTDCSSELKEAIIKGLKERAAELASKQLNSCKPLDIVNGEIIPALNSVGKGFEEKTVYLPQLLMSAEAAKAAFEIIRSATFEKSNEVKKGPFVIATVLGDIHDIGKNIVKLLLENYGFEVIDLGKDVPPERIVDTVIELDAKIVGLSALMTTTLPAMEQTVRLLKQRAPMCKTVVGGAVLTEQYAKKIGADKYAVDAMETVRYAEEIFNK